VTLPYYDVFDWLEGEVRPDGTVVLRGQVVRPTTRKEAEVRVRDIEGVEQVVNEIEVLPASPGDDRLRFALYRAIFGMNSPLFRYATRSVPPIHIIVNRGRATLKGVVATEGDKTIAYTRARGVPGLFDVKNELLVEKDIPR
jgi:hyperosmotically inducible protein